MEAFAPEPAFCYLSCLCAMALAKDTLSLFYYHDSFLKLLSVRKLVTLISDGKILEINASA